MHTPQWDRLAICAAIKFVIAMVFFGDCTEKITFLARVKERDNFSQRQARSRQTKKPGFLENFGIETEMLLETRFLADRRQSPDRRDKTRNRVSWKSEIRGTSREIGTPPSRNQTRNRVCLRIFLARQRDIIAFLALCVICCGRLLRGGK